MIDGVAAPVSASNPVQFVGGISHVHQRTKEVCGASYRDLSIFATLVSVKFDESTPTFGSITKNQFLNSRHLRAPQ